MSAEQNLPRPAPNVRKSPLPEMPLTLNLAASPGVRLIHAKGRIGDDCQRCSARDEHVGSLPVRPTVPLGLAAERAIWAPLPPQSFGQSPPLRVPGPWPLPECVLEKELPRFRTPTHDSFPQHSRSMRPCGARRQKLKRRPCFRSTAIWVQSADAGHDSPDRARLPPTGRDAIYSPCPGHYPESLGEQLLRR